VSYVLGARNANMIARKAEEMRLSIWIEQEMTRRFRSKQRAKEEILARYVSHVSMGHGQYGFATAAQYYFGTALRALAADDADKAAVLAGIPKSPRDHAPHSKNRERIVRRRNETLALMAAADFISRDQERIARERSLPEVARRPSHPFQSSAVVAHILDELETSYEGLSLEDLLQGAHPGAFNGRRRFGDETDCLSADDDACIDVTDVQLKDDQRRFCVDVNGRDGRWRRVRPFVDPVEPSPAAFERCSSSTVWCLRNSP